MDFSEGEVDTKLEFSMKPSLISSGYTREKFEAEITDFANFLKLVYVTEEVNVTTKFHNTTTTEKPLNLQFAEVGLLSSPYVVLNNSLLKVRGDPFIDHRVHQAPMKNASDEEELRNRINPISTFVMLKPDTVKLQAEIDKQYYIQPQKYLGQFEVVNATVIQRANELRRQAEELALVNGGVLPVELTLAQVQGKVYEAFLANCTKYMATMVMDDKVPVLNNDTQTEFVWRTQRVFQTMMDPAVVPTKYGIQKVRLSITEIEEEKDYFSRAA